jgi:PII-like signaling protein
MVDLPVAIVILDAPELIRAFAPARRLMTKGMLVLSRLMLPEVCQGSWTGPLD